LASAGRGALRPDLVVADYNLPNGANGLQVVASLETTIGRNLPAIILSGDISTETLRAIAREGRAYLSKPVTAAGLVRLIEEQLTAPRPAAPASDHPPTIFVVDDDSSVREALRDLLEANGRTVEIYDSGEGFLEAYRPGRQGCLSSMPGCPAWAGLSCCSGSRANGIGCRRS
jgi:two-component system, chemotaxis family, CheB/CheR fusion protein